MQRPFSFALLAIALVSGLVALPVKSYTAVYVLAGAIILAAVLKWRQLLPTIKHPAYSSSSLCVLLLALAVTFHWTEPNDFLIVAMFLPVVLGAGLVSLFGDFPQFSSPVVIGAFCMFGTIGACAMALHDVLVLGLGRAGVGNNPIHFADITAALGLFALVGFPATKRWWRYVFLLGPLLALFAALLSGSRGAILGIVVVSVAALLPIALPHRQRGWLIAGLVAAFLMLAVGFAVFSPSIFHRAVGSVETSFRALAVLPQEDEGRLPDRIDDSAYQRIVLLRGGWKAFLEKPIFGHGLNNYVEAARVHFPERYGFLGGHLHADLADFFVAAGIFGGLAYVLILCAPFAFLIGASSRDCRQVVLVGAVALSGGYFALGLTNAVFGVLPQTVLFGLLFACLGGVRFAMLGAGSNEVSFLDVPSGDQV